MFADIRATAATWAMVSVVQLVWCDQRGWEPAPVERPPGSLGHAGFYGLLHNLAPVLGTFKTVDAASLGAGLRLGWLNAIIADLSIAHVAQGQGLLGTGAVPGLLQTGPRKNTRFFFILTARL